MGLNGMDRQLEEWHRCAVQPTLERDIHRVGKFLPSQANCGLNCPGRNRLLPVFAIEIYIEILGMFE